MKASVVAVLSALTVVLTVTGAAYFSAADGQAAPTLSELAKTGVPSSILAFGFGLFVSLFALLTGSLATGLHSAGGGSTVGSTWRNALLASAAVVVVSLAVMAIVTKSVDRTVHRSAGLAYAVAQVTWIALVLVALYRRAESPAERRRWAMRLLIVLIGIGPAALFVVNLYFPILDDTRRHLMEFVAMGVAPAFLISLVPELRDVRVELVRRR